MFTKIIFFTWPDTIKNNRPGIKGKTGPDIFRMAYGYKGSQPQHTMKYLKGVKKASEATFSVSAIAL